jgi:hypothetical protein
LCSRGGQSEFFTTESAEGFNKQAAVFLGEEVQSISVRLGKLKVE